MTVTIFTGVAPTPGFDINVRQGDWHVGVFIPEEEYRANKIRTIEKAVTGICQTRGCPINSGALFRAVCQKIERSL